VKHTTDSINALDCTYLRTPGRSNKVLQKFESRRRIAERREARGRGGFVGDSKLLSVGSRRSRAVLFLTPLTKYLFARLAMVIAIEASFARAPTYNRF